MRIVLDTNVFVSGVFFSGPPYQILKAWRDGQLQLAISKEILDEYQRVGEALAVKFPGIHLEPILELVTLKAKFFSSRRLPAPLCDDPDDDKFIACALAGKSRIIVSGDKHLLKISGFRTIQVLKPRDFVDAYLRRTQKK
jgi:putative PIN family toxin of toxin-antitoxin system